MRGILTKIKPKILFGKINPKILIGAGAVCVTVVAWIVSTSDLTFFESTSQQSASAAEGAEGGNRVKSVAALARIEPASEIINVSAPIGDRFERLMVREGEIVEAGQNLGFLNSYDERRADRDLVAAKLAEAELQFTAETEVGAIRIEAAEIRLRRAESVYPLRIEAQKAKIRSLEAELSNNRDILKSRSKLKRDQFSSRRSVDDQRTVVRRSEEDLITSRTELKRLETEFELDSNDARNERAQAKADQARAIAAIGVDSLRNQLALSEQGVERAVVRAPIAGEILEIMIRPGESTEGKPILKMGDTRVMHAVAEVYETDVKHVRLGQSARVQSPALAKPLSGRVVDIGRMIFKNDVLNVDPAADADARVVEVRIELEKDPLVSRLTNLTTDAVIDISGTETGHAAANAATSK